MGLPIEPILDPTTRGWDQERLKVFFESDLNIIYQGLSTELPQMARYAKDMKPMTDENGTMRWPPTLICDTDDDLFNVMPLNITYQDLGTRDHFGNEMKPGSEVGISHPHEFADESIVSELDKQIESRVSGARADFKDKRYIYNDRTGRWHVYIGLYKDGVNIDFAANRARLQYWKDLVSHANLVTCSTPAATEYIKREMGDEIRTHVTPNAINFDDYPAVELRDHPGEVRILWAGSASHQEDLWPITDALGRVITKYPQATFTIFGAEYKWLAGKCPAEQIRIIPWVDYKAYKIRMATIGHDIALAPLQPTKFNASRSAIKWYESSALWKPAATLAQNTAAYPEIEEGVTGMLFNDPAEFEEKLGIMIENETLCKTMASNAKDWVNTNREAKKVALALFQKWTEVREGHKLTMPPEK